MNVNADQALANAEKHAATAARLLNGNVNERNQARENANAHTALAAAYAAIATARLAQSG